MARLIEVLKVPLLLPLAICAAISAGVLLSAEGPEYVRRLRRLG